MAADGTDGSGLVINRNMAQALEVPMENWTLTGRCSRLRAITPDNLPDRRSGLTHQLDRQQEYGSAFALLQARRYELR